jgi:rhamnulokinase
MAAMAAVDLGAQSGRVALGAFDGERLSVEEVHRFPNVPVLAGGRLSWDILRLYEDILDGLTAAGLVADVDSVGIDTWGVDFGLLDRQGRLVQNPVHHRDRRTDGVMDTLFAEVPAREIYERTGVQLMPINTLVQLYAAVQSEDAALDIANRLLLIPDLLNYWLCGVIACEYTNATTTQCLDAGTREWATDLLERLRIPTRLFTEVVRPATVVDALLDEVADRTRLRRAVVAVPATHDTASAVAAVPVRSPSAVYISAGTWALVGLELREALIDDRSLRANLTNEGGIDGTVRLLRNVNGFWLVEESRRWWASQGRSLEIGELLESAAEAPPLRSLVDPDAPELLRPGPLPELIQAHCRRTEQPVPEEPGAVVRCILESLALKFRRTIDLLASVAGVTPPEVHVVGGGARNRLLCQWTADATGLPVLAGPEEATVVGNLLAQAIALGEIKSLEQGREVVRASFALVAYEPADQDAWDEAYGRFEELLSSHTTAAPEAVAP